MSRFTKLSVGSPFVSALALLAACQTTPPVVADAPEGYAKAAF
jgi:hypothetical protein